MRECFDVAFSSSSLLSEYTTEASFIIGFELFTASITKVCSFFALSLTIKVSALLARFSSLFILISNLYPPLDSV